MYLYKPGPEELPLLQGKEVVQLKEVNIALLKRLARTKLQEPSLLRKMLLEEDDRLRVNECTKCNFG